MEGSVSSILEDINDRQEGLVPDFSEHTALIAGLGGIGNWIALDLALLGVGTIILYDDDIIEASNLNRTLFKLNQIGKPKVVAVKELISERRKDTIVITFNEKFTIDNLSKFEGLDYFFDCTDTSKLKDSIRDYKLNDKNAKIPKYIKLGYDGFEGTVSMNDFDSGRWGTDSSYQIIPSFFGTPQVLSALAVIEMLLVKKSSITTLNLNVKTILDELSER